MTRGINKTDGRHPMVRDGTWYSGYLNSLAIFRVPSPGILECSVDGGDLLRVPQRWPVCGDAGSCECVMKGAEGEGRGI